jgi:hypothetical protein
MAATMSSMVWNGVGLDGPDHDGPHRHELVGVALVADELRDADRASGAADVVDLDRDVDPVGHDLLQRARGLVPAAAGVGRRHDAHVAGGPAGRLRVRAAGVL